MIHRIKTFTEDEPLFDLVLVILWIAVIPITLWQGWQNSIAYVAAISIYANIASHWAAYRAARLETRVDASTDS